MRTARLLTRMASKVVKKETGLAIKFKKVPARLCVRCLCCISGSITLALLLISIASLLQAENFSDWYSSVITMSEMIDYYDISGRVNFIFLASGCDHL